MRESLKGMGSVKGGEPGAVYRRRTYAVLGIKCFMPPGNGATRMATCACGAREQDDVVMAALWDPPTRIGAKVQMYLYAVA